MDKLLENHEMNSKIEMNRTRPGSLWAAAILLFFIPWLVLRFGRTPKATS